jgi:hypothetical protein
MVNAFLQGLADETLRTLESPRRLGRFWRRVREQRSAQRAARGGDASAPGLLERVTGLLGRNRGLLEAQVAALRNVPTLNRSIALASAFGYGRLDALGIARDELFGSIAGDALPVSAPVSLPHLWGMEYTGWLQWGANTNSVMDRNVAQAIAVGALFDAQTFASTLNIQNLSRLERLAYRMTPPEWPAIFPATDRERAERGRASFQKYCVQCHQRFELDGHMRTYQQFSIATVGTDPMTALNFEVPVRQQDGRIQPLPYAVTDLVRMIKARTYQDAGYTPDQVFELENRAVRRGPRWDPTFRAPLLDSDKWEETRGRRVYRSKTLVGIWATGPFLHNGSVPTVYDLLRPAAARPVTFPVGTRDYDVVKLGIQTDASAFSLAAGQAPFLFDTRLPGNWNTGHEWDFYPELTDEIRYDIIEFLKTFTSETVLDNGTVAPLIDPAPAQSIQQAAPTGTPPPGNSRAALLATVALGLLVLSWPASRVGRWLRPRGIEALATEGPDIAAITEGMAAYQRRCAATQVRPLARGTHAKGTCVRGRFEVFDLAATIPDPVLARRLAQGIFARPGVYPATVRFANAASLIMPDTDRDLRACSFSVELPAGVIGPGAARQDFSAQSATVFTINDCHAFAATVAVNNAPTALRGFLRLPYRDKLGFLRTMAFAVKQLKPAGTPFQQNTYWSTVPFRHGPADVVKYAVMACPGNPAGPLGKGPTCLQDELIRHVTDDEQMSCFDFGLQLLDTQRMTYWGRRRTASFWIENATVEWNAAQAPFHVVGRLTLEKGSVLSPEDCARQWIDVTINSAPGCAPVGSINRARPAAEQASRRARLQQTVGATDAEAGDPASRSPEIGERHPGGH